MRKNKAVEKSRQIQDEKETEDSGAGATDFFLPTFDPVLHMEAQETGTTDKSAEARAGQRNVKEGPACEEFTQALATEVASVFYKR